MGKAQSKSGQPWLVVSLLCAIIGCARKLYVATGKLVSGAIVVAESWALRTYSVLPPFF